MDVRPGLGPSPTDIPPYLKRLNHSQHCVRLIQSSPYDCYKQLKYLCKILPSLQVNFTHTDTHTMLFKHFRCHFVTNPTACAPAKFGGCSSTTNAHSEMGQMAVCCQNLTLGALSSRSTLSVLVGALFKKFGLFLNTPRMLYSYIYASLN